MDDDFFRREFDYGGPQKRDNLFAWTIFILLLAGFALACWLGSFFVFGHPENPRSYSILKKLHKLDPPKRFEYTAAPPGEFLTPQKFYEKYAAMGDVELQQYNASLMRDYIRNYQTTKSLVPYLIGRFTIVNTRELKSSDVFPTGVVALAQASEYPQVLVEYVYTSDAPDVPQLKAMLAPGLDIKLEKTLDLSAIIHAEKLSDGRLLLTAVPLLYGTYTLKQGIGSFSLEPPPALNLVAGVPITKANALPPPAKNYATVRPANPEDGSSPAPTPANAELVRVMAPIALNTPKPGTGHPTPPAVAMATPTPEPSATPEPATPTPMPHPVAVVTPPPVPPAPPTPAFTPSSSFSPPPSTILAENVTPGPVIASQPGRPLMTPSPIAGSSPSPAAPTIPGAPTPAPTSVADHPGVELHPFIEAQATPAAVNPTGGNWKVYHPGQMPRGRLLHPADASALADRGGVGGEKLYLSGQFVVTATGENSAVLRARGGTLNPLDRTNSNTRIIVEFPAGSQPPAEGTNFSRDEMRPFEIRDIQRARDGTVNVVVREVTTEQ